MERIVISVPESELRQLLDVCKKYNLDSLDDCVSMALARLIYIYKGS
ncbi:MAG: hypothetical protein LM577_05900 [Thermoproteaceae archaeon]|nr:hypothetical protein [Thermoproteaceae archaeon]